ncbi:MAG: 2Fe-2S iron-sulfur cluster-binding protein [Janthinobacterium lividum]
MQSSFRVTLERTGTSFEVFAGETLLDAAARRCLWLQSACRNGTCGTCKVTVMAGEVAHDDRAMALSAAERRAGLALTCCAFALGDLRVDAGEMDEPPASEQLPVPARVTRLQRLAPDVMLVSLRFPPNGRISFKPGQYVAIDWEDGRQRAFSVANAPRPDGGIDLHVGLVPGGAFTKHVFERMAQNAIVKVSGPFGAFGLQAVPRPAVFIAAGTGMAPIWSILQSGVDRLAGLPIRVYWGCRSPEGLYLDKELRSLSVNWPGLTYVPLVGNPRTNWTGRRGRLQRAVLDDIPDLSKFDVYACGSPQMVEDVRCALSGQGLQPARFLADSFHLTRRDTA